MGLGSVKADTLHATDDSYIDLVLTGENFGNNPKRYATRCFATTPKACPGFTTARMVVRPIRRISPDQLNERETRPLRR